MAVVQDAALHLKREVRPNQNESTSNTEPLASVDDTSSLTFVTSEGERITFSDLEMPVGDAAAIAGEEALEKIWNRPAEDQAWRAM